MFLRVCNNEDWCPVSACVRGCVARVSARVYVTVCFGGWLPLYIHNVQLSNYSVRHRVAFQLCVEGVGAVNLSNVRVYVANIQGVKVRKGFPRNERKEYERRGDEHTQRGCFR